MTEYFSTITRNGQVTIPAEIRRALDLKVGDIVVWRQEGNEVLLLPARFTLESAFGPVEPRRPEDIKEIERSAKASKAKATVEELSQDHGAS
jgi:AbrB family looped-hinge helix DNA binding protein